MTESHDAVVLARAEERLRQEREIFDQRKAQDRRSFTLKLVMGWSAVFLLVAICALCGFVVIDHKEFTAGTVTAATSALLVEALGLFTGVWRLTLGKGPAELRPTTESSATELGDDPDKRSLAPTKRLGSRDDPES